MAFGDFTVTRASTKNILGSAGLYVSVANNVPAFEFNADGTYRGLLVEPGATNIVERSQEFDNAYWTKTRGAVTANTTVAPDGTTTADTLTCNTTSVGGFLVLRSGLTVVTATTYTMSCYMKKGTLDFCLFIALDGANGVRQWFDLNTGTVASSSTLGTGWTKSGATIEDVGNGWYRCAFAFVTGSTSLQTNYYPSVPADLNSDVTTGDIGILWQAQVELGSVATSPIVTTAGTASRVADVVSLTGASSLIGQASGTLYVELEKRLSGVTSIAFQVGDGVVTNQADIRFDTLNRPVGFVNAGGATVATITGTAVSANTVYKYALRYALNDFGFAQNGAMVGTDASGAAFAATVSRIDVGQNFTNVLQLNGWLRAVALLPSLPNATLQSLTA
jgi:hypothetical protein